MTFSSIELLPNKALPIDTLPIDKQKVAAAFSRAAASYEQHNELQQRTGRALLAELPHHGQYGLDLGCGSGWFAPALATKTDCLLALDLSPAMLQQATTKARLWPICADMDHPPIAKHSLDWIFANLCMQWSADPAAWLTQWSERLAPGGVLVFSTLLDGSLQSLAQCWQNAGLPSPINDFIKPHSLMSALQATGRSWQLQQTTEQLSYPHLTALLKDLKGIGANQVNGPRSTGLMGKKRWQQLNNSYPKTSQGQCMATYHLAYGVIYG